MHLTAIPSTPPFTITARDREFFEERLYDPVQLTADRLNDTSFFKREWKKTLALFVQNLQPQQFKKILQDLAPCILGIEPFQIENNINTWDERPGLLNLAAKKAFGKKFLNNNEVSYENLLTAFWLISSYAKKDASFASNIHFKEDWELKIGSWFLANRQGIDHEAFPDHASKTMKIVPCKSINIGGTCFDVAKVKHAVDQLVRN